MNDQRISGLSGLFGGRLPINRKERYYTGTVLPMIVASDVFKHFGRFCIRLRFFRLGCARPNGSTRRRS